MIKKTIALGILVIMSLGIFTACTGADYSYAFHFSVVGDNGSIVVTNLEDRTSPFSMLGGENRELDFTAIPDEGYQVKEWTFNGKTVEGNKTNSFTAQASYKESPIYITVEFEPIS